MTRFRDFRLFLTLAAGVLTVSTTAARAEYLRYEMKSAMITSYSMNGSGLDDMPAPPPKIAAAPKGPQPALNAYAKLTLNGTAMSPQARSVPSYGSYRLVFPTPAGKKHALRSK